ncbi:hypothetical protein CEXT_605031 [Caerostris extrusa]|uniref:Uncharacterized protein n=1 Tax=Caerostris extrusa TaxID=172846 RepID=A0AAV4YAA7_CAEEX|nr:hypothetical protein CEXT_605031 [Caerostris extrusa]
MESPFCFVLRRYWGMRIPQVLWKIWDNLRNNLVVNGDIELYSGEKNSIFIRSFQGQLIEHPIHSSVTTYSFLRQSNRAFQ